METINSESNRYFSVPYIMWPAIQYIWLFHTTFIFSINLGAKPIKYDVKTLKINIMLVLWEKNVPYVDSTIVILYSAFGTLMQS